MLKTVLAKSPLFTKSPVAFTFVALTTLAQLVFMLAEMFRWKAVTDLLIKMTPICVEESAVLGANQGLYNGFLAAGLFWSLIAPIPNSVARDPDSVVQNPDGRQLALFFLICVVVAAGYGACSLHKPLLFVMQGVLPLLGLIALWMRR